MNRLGAILYGVAVVSITLLLARESLEPSVYLFKEHHAHNIALGVTGLLISTFGPVTLSVCIWLMARRLKARWLVHLIFIPTAIVICREGASLFFDGAGVSGENSPEGHSLFAAGAFLFLTLLVHAAALIVEGYKKIMYRANGG